MQAFWLCRKSRIFPVSTRLPLPLQYSVQMNIQRGCVFRRCSHGAVAAPTFGMREALRGHSTIASPPVPPGDCLGAGFVANGGHSEEGEKGSAASASAASSSSSSPSCCRSLRTVRLHNMPRTWLHEEVMQFLHQVAEHAGIDPPPDASQNTRAGENEDDNEEGEEDTTWAVPRVTSPFVARMHIPFGRRTGIVYGAPIIQLTSDALAGYLLSDLKFDPDDYRSRIYFTEVVGDGSGDHETTRTASSDEETLLRMEQEQALETLELDRYLLAPDLLYDIAKMRQRRPVTRRSKLLLDTFADDDTEGGNEKDQGEENDADKAREKEGLRSVKHKGAKKASKRVGDYKDLGRGSIHNMPLALPYVQGRRGT